MEHRIVCHNTIGGITETLEAAVFEDRQPLTIADPCDRCGGTALVRFIGPHGEVIDFCGHHTRENVDALTEQAWLIGEDKRPR